jgi:toluene monooxygenase system ferredoxin subunit
MTEATMTFLKVGSIEDLWEGEMTEVEVGDHVVVLVWPEGGELRAFQGMCPHQDIPLVEGKFDGKVLMCRAHQWTFDARSGAGINPGNCRLAEYPVKVDGDDILVAVEGVKPLFAST